MNLNSQNLVYIPLCEEHFQFYKIMEYDPEVMHFYDRGVSKNDEDARKTFVKYIEYRKKFPELGAWSVFDSNKAFVGLAVIVHVESKPENKIHEFGYRLVRNQWGKGHATEIAKALVEYAFSDLRLAEIYGTTKPDNFVSQKVLLKAGLTYIGEAAYYNGCKLFKLARDQWSQAPQA